MKPKTKIQQEVWDLYNKQKFEIPNPRFMKSKHLHYYTTHYNNFVCMSCNYMWKDKSKDLKGSAKLTCPNCKKRLWYNNYRYRFVLSFVSTTYVKKYQVFRYFECNMYIDKFKKPIYEYRETFQEWFDPVNYKRVIIGCLFQQYSNEFTYSEMEIRNDKSINWYGNRYDRYSAHYNMPNQSFHPEIKKYNLKAPYYDVDIRDLVKSIMNNNYVETIFKAGCKNLLFQTIYKDFNINFYWPQVKIAIRHGYNIEQPKQWSDYIDMLRELRYDVHNPKYILPKNFDEAHADVVEKLNKRRAKIAFEERQREMRELRRKAETDEVLKGVRKSAFKDFVLEKDNLKVVSLFDPEDVLEEGQILNHCVFVNEYHLKSGILLLSAQVDGERTETVEVSLSDYKIIQARGKNNVKSIYHDSIVSYINNNMGKIRNVVKRELGRKNEMVSSHQN